MLRKQDKKAHASRTAAYVGLLRALGEAGVTSIRGFHDEAVRALLPPVWARAFVWFERAIRVLPTYARRRIIAHVDLFVIRTLAIDAASTTALARGCAQVVVLGAGFDSRAHRLAAVRTAHVFEVDHPATQAEKRRRAAGIGCLCRELTYVACDFECDVLAERLAKAGHRAEEPTLWIWEGVTLYLADDAIQATLSAIAARSAAGSTLIVEYHDADAPNAYTLYAFVRKILLAHWSEPQIGRRSQHAMRADLGRVGLRIEDDFGLVEWGTRFANMNRRSRSHTARIAIATTTATAKA